MTIRQQQQQKNPNQNENPFSLRESWTHTFNVNETISKYRTTNGQKKEEGENTTLKQFNPSKNNNNKLT